MGRFVDLTGKKFGKLVVLWRVENSPAGRTRWLCQCECRTLTRVIGQALIVGEQGCGLGTVSCGCHGQNCDRFVTHGATRNGQSPTYSTWAAMHARCRRPKNKCYDSYGGRGIQICERWYRFENFLADMGEKPLGMSIDRKDSNGNYTPDNCRWATATEQSRNRSMCTITDDRIAEACGRIEHGESQKAVALRMGVRPHTISHWAKIGGVR